jgi:ABC-2 type transport system permease protein
VIWRPSLSLAIETIDLTKRFPPRSGFRNLLHPKLEGGVLAVDRVSLAVQEGEIFGLLGPNGAGKSSLVRMLCTLVLPTAGQARVCGHDLSDEATVKAQVGLASGEERSFYWRLNGRDNLRFYGALQGLPAAWAERRIDELEQSLEISEALAGRFDRLSTGMRRRLDLARALLHDPPILFLDEPTRSLDPGAAARLHEQIRQVARAGHTLFLVTHHLAEAAALCDRVAIMHHGRLRAIASVAELRRAIGPQRRYVLTLSLPPDLPRRPWLEWPWPAQEGPAGRPDRCALEVTPPADLPLDALLRPLLEAGVGIVDVAVEEASLEEIFQRLTADETTEDNVVTTLVVTPPADVVTPPNVTTEVATTLPATPRLPPVPSALRKIAAFLRRDLRVQLSYRLAALLQVAGILFSVAAFYFVARVLGQAASPLLQEYGGNYFAFVLIGIAFAGYQGVGLNSFAEVIHTGQTQGTLEAMLATPTRLELILSASALWSFLQASLQVLAYLLVGAVLFGLGLGQANAGTALLTLALSLFAFSGLGMLSASFILVTKRGDPINFLFTSLSVLMSGVYYPVSVLPAWLQPVAAFLPMTHALRAMRLALLEGAGVAQVAPELAMLGLFTAIVLPGGLLAFRWALRRARAEGSLTQF